MQTCVDVINLPLPQKCHLVASAQFTYVFFLHSELKWNKDEYIELIFGECEYDWIALHIIMLTLTVIFQGLVYLWFNEKSQH